MGIDTATNILNLAIIEKQRVVSDFKMDKAGVTHSAILIPSIENIVNFTGYKLSELGGIAVAIGPGSFTGLRIGLATAKGLSFALSIPLVGVNTLDAYALQREELPGILCPIIRARKGEYYYSLFQKNKMNNRLIKRADYLCKKWTNIKNQLLMLKEPVFIFGYGIEDIFEENISDEFRKSKNYIISKQEPPGAANIALIGAERIIKKRHDNMFTLSPFYISKSAAEIKKEKDISDKEL